MTSTTYTVSGMTCGHCVQAVSTEVGKLAGVTDVEVDLATGAVTVTSDAPLEREAVAAAVDEAGYELVGV
jgi:copper chaperone